MNKFNYPDAINDIRGIISNYRFWIFVANLDIRKRYARSVIGPFWLAISNAIYIFALSLVFTILFKIRSADLVPWIAVGVTIWAFISSYAIETSVQFVNSAPIIQQEKVSFSSLVASNMWKNIIIAAHNFVVYPIVMLVYSIPVTWNLLWLFFTIPLFLFAIFPLGIVLAIFSARLRDLPPLVQSLTTVGFFLTPVMWMPSQLGQYSFIVDFNPFAQFIELLRAPLMGQAPSVWALAFIALFSIFSWGAMILVLARYRHRIAYWI